MGRSNHRLMKSGKKDFQKAKTIRKILMIIGIVLHAFTTTYATQDNDSILFHACNTTWTQKTELAATVFYEDQEEGIDFTLVLDGVSSENSRPEQSTSLKKGNINSISLLLRNYYEEGRNLVGTVLVRADFETEPGFKEIRFEIKKRKITAFPIL